MSSGKVEAIVNTIVEQVLEKLENRINEKVDKRVRSILAEQSKSGETHRVIIEVKQPQTGIQPTVKPTERVTLSEPLSSSLPSDAQLAEGAAKFMQELKQGHIDIMNENVTMTSEDVSPNPLTDEQFSRLLGGSV